MAMDCRNITLLLSALIDDELSAGEAQAVADHVRSCASCGSRQAQLIRAREAFRQWPEEAVSASFGDRLRARLANSGEGVEAGMGGRSRVVVFSLVAVGLAAMLVLIIFPGQRVVAPAVSQPTGTSRLAVELLGIDCGLAYAAHCQSEPLCSSPLSCGPARAMPGFITAN